MFLNWKTQLDSFIQMLYWSVLLLTRCIPMKLCSELISLLLSVENKFRKFDNLPLGLKKETALCTLLFLY